ncbi:MAG: 50S ribosomal protein L3 [Planctomycetes bacterium]|nr:50S ribosomal protein L3 [Planctomycetota bacterium]
MVKLLIGRKLGMTQLFTEAGTVIPVTVLEVGPCPVVQVRDAVKDGYRAVQIGFGVRKEKRTSKPQQGHFRKAGVEPCRVLREAPVAGEELPKPGERITVGQVFAEGGKVDVTATTKGQGFQGTVKRHHFGRGPVTHGSKNTREPGSTGQHTWPGRVYKGKRMPGHMGAVRRTVKNLTVVKIEAEQHRLFLKGAVPGPTGAIVCVQHAKTARVMKKS